MANGGYASVVQIAQQAKDNQKTTQTKSNTIVTACGFVVTCLIYILTKLMETGYDWVPEWTPQVVTFLGFAATVLGVSKTKNYVTDGTIKQLENTVLEMIDRSHDNRINQLLQQQCRLTLQTKPRSTPPRISNESKTMSTKPVQFLRAMMN